MSHNYYGKSFYALTIVQAVVLLRSLGYKGQSVVAHFEDLIPAAQYQGIEIEIEVHEYYDGTKSAQVQARSDYGVWLIGYFLLG